MHLLSFLGISVGVWVLIFHSGCSLDHEVKLILLGVVQRCEDGTSFCGSVVFFFVICFHFFEWKSSLDGFVLHCFLEHDRMHPIFFVHVDGGSWLLSLQLDVPLDGSLWLGHLRVSLACHFNSPIPLVEEVGLLVITLKFDFRSLNIHGLSILFAGLVDSAPVNYRTGLHFGFQALFRVGLH